MDIISLYEDWARDNVNKDENGPASYQMFNRLVNRASLRVLNLITGGTAGMAPPFAYSTEKAKGFVSFLITPYKQQVVGGVMVKPADFYQYENLSWMMLKETPGCTPDGGCDDEEINLEDNIVYKPIEMLDGQVFDQRATTNIELLKPKNKPIAKEVGRNIEFLPLEIGNAKLEYIRYPICGEIKTVHDNTYNDEIADPTTSINSEWDEWARELLLFFMTDNYATSSREQALKQNNAATSQLPGA